MKTYYEKKYGKAQNILGAEPKFRSVDAKRICLGKRKLLENIWNYT
jgi:hypothetical protein